MKKIILFLATAFLLLGCTKNEKEEDYSFITLNPDILPAFSSAPAKKQIVVSTSFSEWKAMVDASNQTWCSVEKKENVLTIEVTRNSDGVQRSAVVTVKAGTLSKEINVVQTFEAAIITLNPDTIEVFPVEGDTKIVTVETDAPSWNVSVDDQNQQWCHVNKVTGTNTFNIIVDPSSSYAIRSAIVTVSGQGAADKTLTVTQSAKQNFEFQPQQQYPVYGIWSVFHKDVAAYSTELFDEIAANYVMIQAAFNTAPDGTVKRMKQINPNFEISVYYNSSILDAGNINLNGKSAAGFRWVELVNRRKDLAHIPTGLIAKDINATDTQFEIINGTAPFTKAKSSIVPCNPSTLTVTPANNLATNNTFWIKTDGAAGKDYKGELMRVISVDQTTDKGVIVTVERGYDNTTPQPHSAKTRVFTPLYNSGTQPGKSSRAYACDPWSGLRRDIMVFNYKLRMNQGYTDGIWNDLTGFTVLVNMVDAKGNVVRLNNNYQDIWSFKDNALYTVMSSAEGQMSNMREAFDQLIEYYGPTYYPLIYANNYNNPATDIRFFEPYGRVGSPHADNPLVRFFNQEVTTITCTDIYNEWNKNPYSPVSASIAYDKITGNNYIKRIEEMIVCAQKGFRVGRAIGDSGIKSRLIEALSKTDRDELELYLYGGYLMGVNPESHLSNTNRTNEVWFGTSPLICDYRAIQGNDSGRSNVRMYKLDEWYWPIGKPIEAFTKSGNILERKFENGYVVVNANSSGSYSLNMADKGGSYYDPKASEKAAITGSVSIPAGTAKIFMKVPEQVVP